MDPRRMYGPATRLGYDTVARTRGVYQRGEMKYFDQERGLTPIVSSENWANTLRDPTTGTLFAPVVGAAINQRIGKACNVLKIKITGTISCPAQSNQIIGDAASRIRLLLVQDLQTNATQCTGTQVMTSWTQPLQAVEGFQNIDNFGRFKVLKDKTIIMQNPNSSWDGTNIEQAGLMRTFKMTVRFRNPVNVRFNATNGGTIADIVDNSFHIIANTNSLDLAPYVSYVSRVCFKE